MHIPGKISIVIYKYCNFINEVDACMCHKEKEPHVKYYITAYYTPHAM